jgi:hypothetical protein
VCFYRRGFLRLGDRFRRSILLRPVRHWRENYDCKEHWSTVCVHRSLFWDVAFGEHEILGLHSFISPVFCIEFRCISQCILIKKINMPKRKVDNSFIPVETSDSSSSTRESSTSEDEDSLSSINSESSSEEELRPARTEYFLGSNEKKVEVHEFNGSVRVDIRSYFRNSDGKWLPTKKGVSLLASEFNDLLNDGNEILRAAETMLASKRSKKN